MRFLFTFTAKHLCFQVNKMKHLFGKMGWSYQDELIFVYLYLLFIS